MSQGIAMVETAVAAIERTEGLGAVTVVSQAGVRRLLDAYNVLDGVRP
jgi:hypothetical protein